ncbi:hypothetical protein COD84_08690 [Bacillus cereus]|nr:hypothetical protein COD84_08690 [Bacillus cereus]
MDFSNPRHLNQSANGQQKFGVGQGLMQHEKYNPSFPSYKWQNYSTGQTHLIMEFKVTVEELLKELQSNKSEKQSEEIDILVCIDLGRPQLLNLNGAITDVNDASRFFSGVTHELHYGGRTINIICLSEILNQL